MICRREDLRRYHRTAHPLAGAKKARLLLETWEAAEGDENSDDDVQEVDGEEAVLPSHLKMN